MSRRKEIAATVGFGVLGIMIFVFIMAAISTSG